MNSDLQYIGNRIREEREKQKLTQEQLAERADIGRRTVQNIELGEKSPSIETLYKISVSLNVPIEMLFSPSVPSIGDIEDIFRRLMSFPAPDQERIIRLFNGILDAYR